MVPWAVQLPTSSINIYIYSPYVLAYVIKKSKEWNHCRRRYILKKAKNTPVYSHNYHTYCYTESYR